MSQIRIRMAFRPPKRTRSDIGARNRDTVLMDQLTVGVLADDAQVTVSRSLFVRNATAVKVIPYDDERPCARLERDRFIRNGVNLDGPRCAA